MKTGRFSSLWSPFKNSSDPLPKPQSQWCPSQHPNSLSGKNEPKKRAGGLQMQLSWVRITKQGGSRKPAQWAVTPPGLFLTLHARIRQAGLYLPGGRSKFPKLNRKDLKILRVRDTLSLQQNGPGRPPYIEAHQSTSSTHKFPRSSLVPHSFSTRKRKNIASTNMNNSKMW